MSTTTTVEVANQVQEFWSPMFVDELLESSMLASLVNREFEGDLRQGGDTVYVSQILRPTAERKTIGSGSDVFNPSLLTTSRVAVVADQRITASFQFEDLVSLQSQLGSQDSAIRKALVESINIELNSYLYSLVSPSTSAPDHTLTSVTDFNAAQLNAVRKLAAQANWSRDGGWWLLADPSYMSDMLNSSVLTSTDFGASDAPVIGGQMAAKRFGFNILEDSSAGLLSLQSGTEDAALAFHPDFLYLVMQQEPRFKVSDKHANNEFGYIISVDMVVGAKLGLEGSVKHISIINS